MQGIVAGPPNSLAVGFFDQPEPCSRALELCVEPSSLRQGMDRPRHIGPGCKSLLPPGRGAFPCTQPKKKSLSKSQLAPRSFAKKRNKMRS